MLQHWVNCFSNFFANLKESSDMNLNGQPARTGSGKKIFISTDSPGATIYTKDLKQTAPQEIFCQI